MSQFYKFGFLRVPLQTTHSRTLPSPCLSTSAQCSDPIVAPKLAQLWKLDLEGADKVDTFIDNEASLIANVFSDLPFVVDYTLLSKLPCFDYSTGWKSLPDLWKEYEVAKFLNSIAGDIAKATGHEQRRTWHAQFYDQILPGSPIERKPDIILLDHHHPMNVTWRNVRAVTEVTCSKAEIPGIVNTVNDKTLIMFMTQFNRTFVPIISIWNDKFRLTVTDRQGQVRSIQYSLSGPHQNQALQLVRLIAALCFAAPDAIGYDSTIIADQNDELTGIVCGDVTYAIVASLFAVQSLVGRATHVFLVKHQDTQYILKDSWIEGSQKYSELDHLHRIRGVEGVPSLHMGGDVEKNGKPLSTWLIRRGDYGIQARSRVRRRLVIASVGSPISSFKSKRELISGFRDIVKSACFSSHQKITTDL